MGAESTSQSDILNMTIDGHRLEYRHVVSTATDARTIVLMHEALGSISLWKEFPQRLVDSCGCNALVYSRYGNGFSDVLSEARQPDYLHREARHVLPELLEKLGISNPILFGHSDGASIALIYAAMSTARVSGLIALAPHVMVENLTLENIRAARTAYQTTDLPKRLAPYHRSPDATFWGWNNIWLKPEFRDWNIEALLPAVRCPLFAIQGREDEYGTLAQLDILERAVPDSERLVLDRCRHSPHRDQPDAVLTAVGDFVGRLRGAAQRGGH